MKKISNVLIIDNEISVSMASDGMEVFKDTTEMLEMPLKCEGTFLTATGSASQILTVVQKLKNEFGHVVVY